MTGPHNLFQARHELRLARLRFRRVQHQRVEVIERGSGEARLRGIDARLAECGARIAELQRWITERENWVRRQGTEPAGGERQPGLLEEMHAELARRQDGDRDADSDVDHEEIEATLRAFREAAGI